MHLLYAFALSLIAACGLYLALSRHVISVIMGINLVSAAVNLVIFYSGRIVSSAPAIIPEGEQVLSPDAANPLPQALILTAIVIGFSLTAVLASIALQTWRRLGTLDLRRIDFAEALGSPFRRKGDRP